MSNLSDFLTTDYVAHFGVTWNPTTMSLRTEYPASICFEIEDKKPSIVQPSGQGVSVIRNNQEAVELLDMESFTGRIHGFHNVPSSCDFAISPVIGNHFLLLNELSRTKSDYVLHFIQPDTGDNQEGKLEKAKKQLTATIERLYSVSGYCDQYEVKTALFSCRLSDKYKKGIMARSARSFSMSIYKLQKMRLHESLPHGFVFKMRIYSEEFRIE